MSQSVILAIDEGTTNTKAIVVTPQGEVIAKSSEAVALFHPHPGWAEQDPEAIWQATLTVIGECLKHIDVAGLSGIAISNQRESVLVWERKTGRPLSPLISWQCRRSEDICHRIARREEAAEVVRRTGMVIDPLYPASKIKWLLSSIEQGWLRAENGELCVGTVDSWLVWQLTGGVQFVTDFSNASRYQLFNIHQLCWDPFLLDLYEIPRPCLPEVVPSCGVRGVTIAYGRLPANIPILAQAGDSHAALYGQGGFEPGLVKATYGTGSSLMVRVDQPPTNHGGVCCTVAWHDGAPHLALEGNITHSGAAIQFIAGLLGISDIARLSELAWSVPDTQGVCFVPALAGLGAPYWDDHARGLICGLTDSVTPAHIARAAFEAVAYQVADLLFAMESVSGMTISALSVDGGPTRNRALMQFQANVLRKKIIKRNLAEVSALGAAFLGGRALGWWQTYDALAQLLPSSEEILPETNSSKVNHHYHHWKQAIQRACFRSGNIEE